MATATTTPNATTSNSAPSDLPIKTENVVYGRFVKAKTSESGKTEYTAKTLRAPSKEDVEAMEKDGYKLQVSQTVTTYRAGNPDGFLQIISDPDEATNIFNRGLAQKESNKMVALFNESKEDGTPEFQFSEDAYDSRDEMNKVTSRRNLSPQDKAIKTLRATGLPEHVIKGMIESMFAGLSASGE